jgi:hypothetical protein
MNGILIHVVGIISIPDISKTGKELHARRNGLRRLERRVVIVGNGTSLEMRRARRWCLLVVCHFS